MKSFKSSFHDMTYDKNDFKKPVRVGKCKKCKYVCTDKEEEYCKDNNYRMFDHKEVL